MLDSARLNGRATTSTLPQSIGTLMPREVATIVLRFPSTAAPNIHGELSGTGTSHGEHVGGAVQITIPYLFINGVRAAF